MRLSQEQCIVIERDKSFFHVKHLLDGINDYFDEVGGGYKIINSGLRGYFLRGYQNYDAVTAVFCWLVNSVDVRFVEQIGVPFLNFGGVETRSNVGIDIGFKDIGTYGAHFLLDELQLENVGVIEHRQWIRSDSRVREFVAAAKAKGADVKTCLVELDASPGKESTIEGELEAVGHISNQIASFLAEMRKPAGVFCVHGMLGISTVNIALGMGLDPYREVKIICPSNHCHDVTYHQEAISTIQLNFRELGYRGAEMMMRYLATGQVPEPVRLRPMGVSPCEKSNFRLIADPLVRRVYSLIRGNNSMSVGMIAEELNVPRATLYRRFKQATNQALSKAIEDERFRAAALLMKTTDFRPDVIAGLAGYVNLSQMRRSIHRYTRLSLKEFSDQCRIRGRIMRQADSEAM